MARLLESKGLEITLKNLEVGDYVVSDRVAVERKTAQDFVASIIDPERNLFRQIADLSRSYERPVLILEGRDLYSRQVGVEFHSGSSRGQSQWITAYPSFPQRTRRIPHRSSACSPPGSRRQDMSRSCMAIRPLER